MEHPLHIAFFGSSLVSTFWSSAAGYFRGILGALADRGHRITFIEPETPDRERRREVPDPAWAERVTFRATSPWSALQAVERVRGADLVIKSANIGLFDDVLEAAVLELRTPRTIVGFWDTDPLITLDRMDHNLIDPLRAHLGRYDVIFTQGGGSPAISAYQNLGASLCVSIYNAFDPQANYPVPADSRFASDLAFLGRRLPDREARMEEFLIQTATRLPKHRFLLGGEGWEDLPLPRNVTVCGRVAADDLNAFNSTPGAILNIARPGRAVGGFAPSARIFEAAAAGACLITDTWPGLELFLEPDKEVLVARDGHDVVRHLDALDRERARAIGVAARRRMLAEHTYAHRAAQIEEVIVGRRSYAHAV